MIKFTVFFHTSTRIYATERSADTPTQAITAALLEFRCQKQPEGEDVRVIVCSPSTGE